MAELFLGLVVIAQAKHPDPSRTRPLSAVAPMVLRLKAWESRSLPNLERVLLYLSCDVRIWCRLWGKRTPLLERGGAVR